VGADVLGGDGTPGTALARYDALPPTDLAQLRGTWRGGGIPTGHRLDGALERLGWYGKRFDDEERVHPLLFRSGSRIVSVNPAVVPLDLALRCAPALRTAAAGAVLRVVSPLITTARPHGRLRAVRYRGVVSTALVYDDLPVLDVFRTVDDATVVGAMDARGMAEPYLFVLRRVGGG
jgi:hypothetical protein